METYGPFDSLEAVVRFWTLILGLWAISATVCLGLASWKEKNIVLWTLLGLMFGPVALVILWFKSRKPEVDEQAGNQSSPGQNN